MGGRVRRWCRGVLVAAAVAAPAAVWAAEGGGGRSPWYDLAMKFVNFGILAGILFYFLRKPVSQGLADRRENIRRALEEARKAKEDAEAKLRDYQARVANLEEEVRQIREDFRAEGERQRDRILAEARQAAEAIQRQAELTADSEVKRARDGLKAEAAELAVRLAEELLARAYSPEDQKRAVRATIESIERTH